MVTTIQIQDDTWEMLMEGKKRGETFDDVIKRLCKSKSFKQGGKRQ